MDSTKIPVYVEQESSAYNRYYESICYHTLLLFNGNGDCLASKLRPGNVHNADGWAERLLPEIERQQSQGKKVMFRADATFAKPEIYEALERRGVKYAIRIPSNGNLVHNIAELLPRSVWRPRLKPMGEFKSFLYCVAGEDREWIVNEFATTAGENLRAFCQADTISLALWGRKSSDAAVVRENDEANRGAAIVGGLINGDDLGYRVLRPDLGGGDC